MLILIYNFCTLLTASHENIHTNFSKVMFCIQVNEMLFIRWHVWNLKYINDLKAFLFRSLTETLFIIRIRDLIKIITIKYVNVVNFV